MTRQDFLKKWFVYGLVLVLTAGLQSFVFSRLRPLGVTPVLLPLALAALASLEGAAAGAGFGVGVGVLSMYVDGGSAWVILLYCLVGLVTGLMAQHVLSRNFVGYLVCSLGALALRMAWHVLTRWYAGSAALPVLMKVGGLELAWTMVLCPIVYFMFRFACRRWGSAYYM